MLPGPMKASCACGCGLFGRPRTGKLEGHVRLCPCKRCQGGRNRTKGLNHQRKAAKALSIPKGASMRSGQEEHWGGAVRVEVKSGAQCGPIITRFRLYEAQSEAQRAIGDHRPFLAAVSHDGLSLGIFRLDQAANIAAALAENLGLLVGEDAEDPADHGRDVGRHLGQVEPELADPGLTTERQGGVEDVHHGDHLE
jgi:hypothetical protein